MPAFNFMHIPVVESRYPLWDRSDPMPVVTGLSHTCRESLVTSVKDAEPQHRMDHPDSSIWPFLMAVATGITHHRLDLHSMGLCLRWRSDLARGHRLVLAKERNGSRIR